MNVGNILSLIISFKIVICISHCKICTRGSYLCLFVSKNMFIYVFNLKINKLYMCDNNGRVHLLNNIYKKKVFG